MLDSYELRLELDHFLKEHSIYELLEMVMFAVQRREEELKSDSEKEE